MNRGFSLVELSIVLVILGLLTGGILAGQSLIRAAELRSVSSEFSNFSTATQTFRDKYFAKPGDFADATRFWGRQTSTSDCVTNSSATVNASGACDGNGNNSMDIPGAVSQSGEIFQFWRHLASAGLIEGAYSGVAGAGGVREGIAGSNAPASRLNSGMWYTRTVVNVGNSEIYNLDYGNMLQIGGFLAASVPTTGIMKPEEAWNIDTKMDDGRPAYGKVVAMKWDNACADASSNTDYDSNYRLTDSATQCSLAFRHVY